jgi:hypothetical protein
VYILSILTANSCTSPEDQKILEEEFTKNQRPDKATRIYIVSRVTLGEKEVQIWFQNRRQNSRKKSRLSDPSLADNTLHGLAIDMSTAVTKTSPDTNRPEEQVYQSQSTVLDLCTSTTTEQVNSSTADANSQSITSSQSSITTGYIANRRTITARAEEDAELLLLHQPILPLSQSTQQSRTLARSQSSSLRLSLTGDGLAKIVDRAAASPEKTSPSEPRSAGLRRSYSAAGLHERPSPKRTSQSSARKVPRMSGRSRDSRTWEFWCDSDARNSLVEMAEKETSGSAAEAIGLIRSKSNRALKMNPSKMNSPNPGHALGPGDGNKKARPPLRKSFTAVGIMSPPKKSKAGVLDDEEDFEHLNEESDKENADPSGKAGGRSGPFVRKSTKVLGENDTVKSQASSLGALMSRERHARNKRRPSVVDKEVADFMGIATPVSPPREADLDCAQGLLNLSQGNWV